MLHYERKSVERREFTGGTNREADEQSRKGLGKKGLETFGRNPNVHTLNPHIDPNLAPPRIMVNTSKGSLPVIPVEIILNGKWLKLLQ